MCVCGGVLTSRGMLGFPRRAQLRRDVQLRHAHAENQSLLEVVHHRQTLAVPEHHPGGVIHARQVWSGQAGAGAALNTYRP